MTKEDLTTDTAKNIWAGDFGNEYSDRNDNIKDYEIRYKNDTGFTQQEIFEKFFHDFDKDISILEVGCNRGLKLLMLKEMGFTNLTGIEVNQKAYELAKRDNPTAKIFHSSIENFDSESKKYDLVFTSTLLIHIPPNVIERVISKMTKLSKKYIFGLEFFADELVEVPYRGLSKALWKQNFPKIFQKNDPTLIVKKIEFLPYKNEVLQDVIYLLEKNQ